MLIFLSYSVCVASQPWTSTPLTFNFDDTVAAVNVFNSYNASVWVATINMSIVSPSFYWNYSVMIDPPIGNLSVFRVFYYNSTTTPTLVGTSQFNNTAAITSHVVELTQGYQSTVWITIDQSPLVIVPGLCNYDTLTFQTTYETYVNAFLDIKTYTYSISADCAYNHAPPPCSNINIPINAPFIVSINYNSSQVQACIFHCFFFLYSLTILLQQNSSGSTDICGSYGGVVVYADEVLSAITFLGQDRVVISSYFILPGGGVEEWQSFTYFVPFIPNPMYLLFSRPYVYISSSNSSELGLGVFDTAFFSAPFMNLLSESGALVTLTNVDIVGSTVSNMLVEPCEVKVIHETFVDSPRILWYLIWAICTSLIAVVLMVILYLRSKKKNLPAEQQGLLQ